MTVTPVGLESVLDDVLPLFPTEDEAALAESLRASDLAGAADDPATWELPDEDVDVDIVTVLDGPVHPADLLLLDSLDVDELDQRGQLARLRALDSLDGLLAAMRTESLVALAGARPSGAYLVEVAVENAVAVARCTSRYAAGVAIETARALTTTFPAFLGALRAGEVSETHCRVLVERTRPVRDPAALAAIERAVLPHARTEPAGRFADAVDKAIARHDTEAAGRFRRARQERRVSTRRLPDGMGFLGLVHTWSTIDTIGQVVAADGRRMQAARRAGIDADPVDAAVVAADLDVDDTPGAPLRADQARADALAGRLLGLVGPDGSIAWDPAPVQVQAQLVIDLPTLRREAEHPCLLDGTPVPAEIGRDLAGYARAWRRMVTDPVTGHLLDYGRQTYLPAPLRTYDLARDDTCRAPDCSVRDRTRLQIDHELEFPAGPSSAANTGALCPTCHQLKTARLVDITDSAADGSCTWHTVFGQTVHVPPRAYLCDPDPPPRPDDDASDDPPPY